MVPAWVIVVLITALMCLLSAFLMQLRQPRQPMHVDDWTVLVGKSYPDAADVWRTKFKHREPITVLMDGETRSISPQRGMMYFWIDPAGAVLDYAYFDPSDAPMDETPLLHGGFVGVWI